MITIACLKYFLISIKIQLDWYTGGNYYTHITAHWKVSIFFVSVCGECSIYFRPAFRQASYWKLCTAYTYENELSDFFFPTKLPPLLIKPWLQNEQFTNSQVCSSSFIHLEKTCFKRRTSRDNYACILHENRFSVVRQDQIEKMLDCWFRCRSYTVLGKKKIVLIMWCNNFSDYMQ